MGKKRAGRDVECPGTVCPGGSSAMMWEVPSLEERLDEMPKKGNWRGSKKKPAIEHKRKRASKNGNQTCNTLRGKKRRRVGNISYVSAHTSGTPADKCPR